MSSFLHHDKILGQRALFMTWLLPFLENMLFFFFLIDKISESKIQNKGV